MHITSPAFGNNERIPSKYAKEGENINPPLVFHNVPKNTQSLVLIIDDYDVPRNLCPQGFYDHWVLFNIPPNTTSIKEDSIPKGVQGKNTEGQNAYIGPAPPDKEHRYNFKLYALSTTLNLKDGATKKEVEEAIKDFTLEKATLIGRYAPKS